MGWNFAFLLFQNCCLPQQKMFMPWSIIPYFWSALWKIPVLFQMKMPLCGHKRSIGWQMRLLETTPAFGSYSSVFHIRIVVSMYVGCIMSPPESWPHLWGECLSMLGVSAILTGLGGSQRALYHLHSSLKTTQCLHACSINPFTPELKKCILPTFQKAIVWVM